MKVILSVEPVRFPLTGIGRYAYELAKGMQSSDEIEELKLFSGTRFLPGLPEPASSSGGTHGLKQLVQKSSLAMEAYRLLMPILRKQALKGHEDFIYHGPNFFLPPFPGRKVATFHDLSPFKWAECFDPVKVKYLQREFRKTLDTADALITDSEFTRHELAEFAGWPLEKIHAIPLAAGPEFRPRTESEVRKVLSRYGLTYQGYSLFVGTIEPRKNIIRLLEAYEQLPKSVRQRWPLVLTGYRGWKSDDIHARIKDAEREGWAKYLGFLPAEELPLMYSAARLFVFPSLYEGFGLPVLEAMQSGVPVVCSNQASLPEVVGDAALHKSPDDLVGLADAFSLALGNDEQRKRMISGGLLQAEGFTWGRCVKETVMVYRNVFG
ncbi:glycosyltransferase family 4 protein [Marinobacter subterrani]|uniref:Glycosyltransferase involved in cell wall bisynthesis n=1 Tax=Marinobacter subterrani TaxID=1658765 RepID=A0A0J7M1U1_9GAMM|nr:glycosyltransferase family 1 protein [Marinobacter subterrani]KMQ75040.1 Glycosyltransferase involved in cell wall bisynthesis [Marinobacter subterrani]